METININGGGGNMPIKQQQELFKIIRQAERQDISLQAKFKKVFNFIDHNFKARHEPEPPTVRPMSELPLNDERCIFLLKYRVEGQEWKTGTFKNGIKQPYVDLDDRYWHYYEDNYRCDATGKTIIGWLPLPNPNDIKL